MSQAESAIKREITETLQRRAEMLALSQLNGVAIYLDWQIECFTRELEIAGEMDSYARIGEAIGGQVRYCRNVIAGIRKMLANVLRTITRKTIGLKRGKKLPAIKRSKGTDAI